MTIERAIEILNPAHREDYTALADGLEQVEEACRMGMQALERQIRKKPTIKAVRFSFGYTCGNCPVCGSEVYSTVNTFCNRCGQALDWSDEK